STSGSSTPRILATVLRSSAALRTKVTAIKRSAYESLVMAFLRCMVGAPVSCALMPASLARRRGSARRSEFMTYLQPRAAHADHGRGLARALRFLPRGGWRAARPKSLGVVAEYQ